MIHVRALSEITVFEDRSFTFITKAPLLAAMVFEKQFVLAEVAVFGLWKSHLQFLRLKEDEFMIDAFRDVCLQFALGKS